MPNYEVVTIKNKIYETRKKHNISLAELSVGTGISKSMLICYEDGLARPKPQILNAIARMLCTTPDYLYEKEKSSVYHILRDEFYKLEKSTDCFNQPLEDIYKIVTECQHPYAYFELKCWLLESDCLKRKKKFFSWIEEVRSFDR